jgi:hypothetical protein
MSKTDDIRPRHYKLIKGLIRRNKKDVSQTFREKRSFGSLFNDLLPPKPKEPSLVSSFEGSIETILFTIPKYVVNDLEYAYVDLIQKLPPYVELILLVHESVKDNVKEWMKNNAKNKNIIIPFPDHIHFSVWAEDGYVAAIDKSTNLTYFIEPHVFLRYGDSLIADYVSNSIGNLLDTQAPLYFQGGNLLIGDDFFFIGSDYPAESLQYIQDVLIPSPGESRKNFIRRLYNEYLDVKKRVIYIGSNLPVPSEKEHEIFINGHKWTEILYYGNKEGTMQPLFHIDMFITLVGRNDNGKFQVLVGDPSLAFKILGKPLPVHSMQNIFDNIAKNLNNIGFDVIRNPLPLVYMDDTQRRERIWYFATSNNALVQNSKDKGKIVWLPTYGHGNWTELIATDNANVAIWKDLGYEVRTLSDFHPFAENLGAVHCIKKYLKRGI